METFFTSDLHFGHKNIMSYDNRPFASVEEMDTELIRRWNNKVSQKDTVYILGDISWYPADKTAKILRQLNGRKILIQGNHDHHLVKHPDVQKCFAEIASYKEIKLDGRRLILFHYPIPFFNCHFHGAIHLYGHVHATQEWIITENIRRQLEAALIPCRMYNVGCMLWDYEPVTLEEILRKEEGDEPDKVSP